MVHEPSLSQSNQCGTPSEVDFVVDPRRELELELIKIRSEAAAARLEAKAAELELKLRRMSRRPPTESAAKMSYRDAGTGQPAAPHVGVFGESASMDAVAAQTDIEPETQTAASAAISPPTAFGSWDAVRRATFAATPGQTPSTAAFRGDSAPGVPPPISLPPTGSLATGNERADDDEGRQRIDTAVPVVPRPKFIDSGSSPADTHSEPVDQDPSTADVSDERIDDGGQVAVQQVSAGASEMFLQFADMATRQTPLEVQQLALDSNIEAEDSTRRKSPAALVVSTLLHFLILVLLAAVTLNNRSPKDQVAIAASVSNPAEESMETFEIQTSEPEADPAASETEYELSPVGEMQVAEFSPEAPPAPPAPAAAAMLSSAQMSAAAMTLQSDSEAKIQFCGLEGGGNHFVYLVDSSGSMGDGFESARRELLQSIDVLKPDQRFYVVFFDAQPDYMRLRDPNTNEPRSAYATSENKQALKRWAMGIEQNVGRHPEDPLKFALDLKPDVIFLLSDGEFPQRIEDLLKRENRIENLFGDDGPISIVHTIGYYSREGENIMKRIAQQNKGQYRHVPKP